MASGSFTTKSKTIINNVGSAISAKPTFSIAIFILATFFFSRLVMVFLYKHYVGFTSFGEMISRVNIFDAVWYRAYIDTILQDVYRVNAGTGQAPWAFFPLMPMIINAICKVLRLSVDPAIVGTIVNSIFFMLSEFVAYKYIMLTRKDLKLAFTYVLFMSFGLYSFYFSLFYTESLFLLLLTLCFYFLKKKQYILMGLCGALLSATRNVGIMFVFVVLVTLIEEYVTSDKIKKKNVWSFIKQHIVNENLIFGTFIIPLGFFLYVFFLYKKLGDAFAFIHAEAGWGRVIDSYPFEEARNSLLGSFPPSYLGMAFLISVLIIIYALISGKRFSEMIMPVITIFLSASTTVMSVPRYMVASFTVVLFSCEIFGKLNKTARFLITAVILVFECVLLREWFHGNPELC